jgi:purine-binding chemotaxis protein CheW
MSEKKQDTSKADAEQAHKMQIVVFKIGQEEYGLHIDQIKEVVVTPNITQMPQTPSYVRGVANVRGNVIAMIDLQAKFGLAGHEDLGKSENKFTLVVESEDYKMGILVREVPNTLSVSPASIESSVFTGGDHEVEQSYITGIIKLDKRLIIMIDIFKVISEQEAQQLFNKQNAQRIEA